MNIEDCWYNFGRIENHSCFKFDLANIILVIILNKTTALFSCRQFEIGWGDVFFLVELVLGFGLKMH